MTKLALHKDLILETCSWLILKFHMGAYMQAMKQEKVHMQGELKLTHMNFVILNSFVKIIHLRFLKKPLYLGSIKQKNWK